MRAITVGRSGRSSPSSASSIVDVRVVPFGCVVYTVVNGSVVECAVDVDVDVADADAGTGLKGRRWSCGRGERSVSAETGTCVVLTPGSAILD